MYHLFTSIIHLNYYLTSIYYYCLICNTSSIFRYF